MEIVFVGTGVSTAIPVMGHFGRCACHDATHTPNSKNRRNNVSILISKKKTAEELQREVDACKQKNLALAAASNGTSASSATAAAHAKRNEMYEDDVVCDTWNVLIDCGKTFRTAYFEQLVHRRLRSIDALLLTHEHADAIQGLDDLRDLQLFEERGLHWVCLHYIPTFLTASTLKTLDRQVGYIVRNSRQLGPAATTAEEYRQHLGMDGQLEESDRIIERRSTALDLWTLVEDMPQPFFVPKLCVDGVVMYALPVEHGKNYISLGFVFGSGVQFKDVASDDESVVVGGSPSRGDCVVYISDVSSVPAASLSFLKRLVKIDLLIVDVLLGPHEEHFSHYCWDDAWALVRLLCPTRVYGVGMYCSLEHQRSNEQLSQQLLVEQSEGSCTGVASFELAYDGLILPMAV